MDTTRITREQALALVYDCYTTGRPEADAVTLTGRSPMWVAAEYRRLKRRGICAVPGQLDLFDTSG